MHFARDEFSSDYLIRAYETGCVRIGQTRFECNLILTPERIVEDWPPQCIDDLDAGHISELAALEPEILLLGTGVRLHFPPPALTGPLLERGIGVEVMDTAAACRTFNILLSEGRRVVAALLLR